MSRRRQLQIKAHYINGREGRLLSGKNKKEAEPLKMKKCVCAALALSLLFTLCAPSFAQEAKDELRLIAPENWELCVGDGRTLDYVFPKDITERMLTWESSDGNVAAVDEWGRVTALAPGKAVIRAKQITRSGQPLEAEALLQVVAAPTAGEKKISRVDFTGGARPEVLNFQKVIARFAADDPAIPDEVREAMAAEDKSVLQKAVTADGAEWSVTDYGVLRRGGIGATERDYEMRFMGDRYFYEADTTDGRVLAILPDGENGLWTIMETGVTHIKMLRMSAAEKASVMSENTQKYVSRRGMVAQAHWNGSRWIPQETDNDGLWTAMYGGGELFRYAVLRGELKKNPRNKDLRRMTEEARRTATRSTEAVLLLANISMRTGTTQAYVRYIGDSGYRLQKDVPVFNEEGKSVSKTALLAGGDYSLLKPDVSPKDNWDIKAISPVQPDAWADPQEKTGAEFARRTRLLEGFVARTYSLHGEEGGGADDCDGQIYWDFADCTPDDPHAVGRSESEGVVNNEDLKGVHADASGSIPERLWNDLLGPDVKLREIVYKGDTSTDELIGHLFLYKLAYDVFRDEDPELAGLIASTTDRLARHLSDNEYLLVDATGQPTTWGKMSRDYFYTYRWGAPSGPLTAGVLLTAFKVAAYCTGYQKWEDEYRLLLNEGVYLYGDVLGTHSARDREFMDRYAAPVVGGLLGGKTLSQYWDRSGFKQDESLLLRMFAQYSDEEMAILMFYTLFQLEDDPDTLTLYRNAFDQWWNESMSYTENPLWYYVYQLAYPDETISDAYGNNILDTAAWTLSRHPIDTRRWLASNKNRDDVMVFNLEDYSSMLKTRGGLTVKKTGLPPASVGTVGICLALLVGGVSHGLLKLEYTVAPPDERSMHKYNGPSYRLDSGHEPDSMEGSTTYTLPYWLGVYHKMLKLSYFENPDGPAVQDTGGEWTAAPCSVTQGEKLNTGSPLFVPMLVTAACALLLAVLLAVRRKQTGSKQA